MVAWTVAVVLPPLYVTVRPSSCAACSHSACDVMQLHEVPLLTSLYGPPFPGNTNEVFMMHDCINAYGDILHGQSIDSAESPVQGAPPF